MQGSGGGPRQVVIDQERVPEAHSSAGGEIFAAPNLMQCSIGRRQYLEVHVLRTQCSAAHPATCCVHYTVAATTAVTRANRCLQLAYHCAANISSSIWHSGFVRDENCTVLPGNTKYFEHSQCMYEHSSSKFYNCFVSYEYSFV